MCGPRRQADPGGSSHNINHINNFNLFTFLHLALISSRVHMDHMFIYSEREKVQTFSQLGKVTRIFFPPLKIQSKHQKSLKQPLKSHITVRNKIFKLIRGKIIILR